MLSLTPGSGHKKRGTKIQFRDGPSVFEGEGAVGQFS